MQTIMIVEDDPVIREELAFLLGNENYRGLPGRDGLSLCAAHLSGRGESYYLTFRREENFFLPPIFSLDNYYG